VRLFETDRYTDMETLDFLHALAQSRGADIAVFSGEINSVTAEKFITELRKTKVRTENLILVLTTNGGEPDAGYRIIRAIKRHYTGLTLVVFGYCKSTGTLMALGADKIIMTELGELGPLDIQLVKDDELVNTSGLSYLQSLYSLNENLINFFESHFLQLKRRSGNTITTKTAAHISHELTTGLIAPISSQIDPIKLGEVQRAMKIAEAYGTRLCNKRNLIQKLIGEYPSHSFVIDKDEAKEIFGNLEEPDEAINNLENALNAAKITRYQKEPHFIQFFSKEALERHQQEAEKEKQEQQQDQQNDTSTTTQKNSNHGHNTQDGKIEAGSDLIQVNGR
jgi:hypothetical protein